MDDVRWRATVPAVRIAGRGVAALVDALDADDVALSDATDLWQAFDRIERLASNAKTLLAARVEEAGAWKRAGARSAADHLAKLGGTTAGAARRSLETSKHVAGLHEVAAAARGGVLSPAQLEAIATAAAADPAAEGRLVALSGTTNITELREEALRTRAAADVDRDATHRRIHESRHVRTYTDAEGAWNLHARGPAEQGAAFEAKLAPLVDEMFANAQVRGSRELREAYVFDAIVALGGRDEAPNGRSRTPKPRFLALLHVDAEALVRGETEGDERCEIPGVGPIPVRIARDLLGDAILKLVITKGVDVVNVVHLGRGPTAAQRIALLWSKPKCANVACSSMYVQLDHRIPWAETKHTRLQELDPLCPYDHDLKTNEGWSLVEGTGRRAFVGPGDPRHPRNKPPP